MQFTCKISLCTTRITKQIELMGVKREDDFEISRDIAHRDKADVIFFCCCRLLLFLFLLEHFIYTCINTEYIIKNVFFFNIEKTLNMLFCICRTMLIFFIFLYKQSEPYMGPMKLILVEMWRCTHMHDSKKKMWWSITSANYCILVTFYIFFYYW